MHSENESKQALQDLLEVGPQLIPRVHFQIYATETGNGLRWRLLSGNRREIGRSAAVYSDTADCRDDIARVSASVDDIVLRVYRAEAPGWTWDAVVNNVVVASSNRRFDRQIRCAQAAKLFVELASDAVIHPVVMHPYRRRGGAQLGTEHI